MVTFINLGWLPPSMSDTPARIPTMEELRATIHAIPGLVVREKIGGEVPDVNIRNPSSQFFIAPHNAVVPRNSHSIFARKNGVNKRMIAALKPLAEKIAEQLNADKPRWNSLQVGVYDDFFERFYLPTLINTEVIGTRTTYEKERIEINPELGGRRYTIRRPNKQPIVRKVYLVVIPDPQLPPAYVHSEISDDGLYRFKMWRSDYEAHIERKENSD